MALHSWPWVACSHSHASLGTVWKSLVIINDNQRNFLCLPLRALHLLVPPALHQRPAGSSGHLGWCWWAHPSSGHSLQPSGGEGRRGDGRRWEEVGGGRRWEQVGVSGGGRVWEGPSQPSCHSCWCEHTRLSRARWRSLACLCHCFNSQTLNSQLKSEPIIWKHMVVNVVGTMVAMVDDKGYIWMGSSNFKVSPATLQVVLAGRGPGSCLLAHQLSSSPHPHLLSYSDLPL